MLAPLLGIGDVRTDKRIDFVGGARGTAELEHRGALGRARPWRSRCTRSASHDLMAIADAGGIMPPKSTWFEPKLRDGLLSHVSLSRRYDRGRQVIVMPLQPHRIFNFSAGPAVLPLPVLEQAQRDLVALPGVGMSVMEISHRSKTFEDLLNRRHRRHPRAGRRAGELQGADAAGRRQPAVLDGADEPARRRGDGRLHRHRHVGGQGDQGGQEGRHGERHRLDQGGQLQPHSRASASLR